MPYSCINIILNEKFKNGYNRNQSELKKRREVMMPQDGVKNEF